METASFSPKLAQQILEQAVKQEKAREAILKSSNLKLQWDKQGKHIPGKHNYISGRSVLEHSNPQQLIEKFAGSGRRVNHNLPGKPGYKEIVDFDEKIGIWNSKDGKISLPTTRGTIHYSKDGCHIVPAEPRSY